MLQKVISAVEESEMLAGLRFEIRSPGKSSLKRQHRRKGAEGVRKCREQGPEVQLCRVCLRKAARPAELKRSGEVETCRGSGQRTNEGPACGGPCEPFPAH